jgi:hypothetical protein
MTAGAPGQSALAVFYVMDESTAVPKRNGEESFLILVFCGSFVKRYSIVLWDQSQQH